PGGGLQTRDITCRRRLVVPFQSLGVALGNALSELVELSQTTLEPRISLVGDVLPPFLDVGIAIAQFSGPQGDPVKGGFAPPLLSLFGLDGNAVTFPVTKPQIELCADVMLAGRFLEPVHCGGEILGCARALEAAEAGVKLRGGISLVGRRTPPDPSLGRTFIDPAPIGIALRQVNLSRGEPALGRPAEPG